MTVTATGALISASLLRVAVIVTGAILRAESDRESVAGACAPAAIVAMQEDAQKRRNRLFTVCSMIRGRWCLLPSAHRFDDHAAFLELRDVLLRRNGFVGGEDTGFANFPSRLHLPGDRQRVAGRALHRADAGFFVVVIHQFVAD